MEGNYDNPRPLAKFEQGLAQITKLEGNEGHLGFNLENPTQEFVFDPRVLPPDTEQIHPKWGEPETQPQIIETQVIETDRIRAVMEKADSALKELMLFSRREVQRFVPQIGQFVADNRLHLAATASAAAIAGMTIGQAGEIAAPPVGQNTPVEGAPRLEQMQGAEQVSDLLDLINHEPNPDLEIYRALLKLDPGFQKKHFKVMEAYKAADQTAARLYDLPPAIYTLSLPDGTKVKVYAQGDALTVSWQAGPGGRLSAEEWMADSEEQKKLVMDSTRLKPTNIEFSKDPSNPIATGAINLKDSGGKILAGKVEVNQRSQVVLKLAEQDGRVTASTPSTDQRTTQTHPNG